MSTVYVNWGDGSPRARIRRTTASHVYTRIRTDTITITLTDRAGNKTVIVHKLKIKAKPKPKKHKKGKAKKGPDGASEGPKARLRRVSGRRRRCRAEAWDRSGAPRARVRPWPRSRRG